MVYFRGVMSGSGVLAVIGNSQLLQQNEGADADRQRKGVS